MAGTPVGSIPDLEWVTGTPAGKAFRRNNTCDWRALPPMVDFVNNLIT